MTKKYGLTDGKGKSFSSPEHHTLVLASNQPPNKREPGFFPEG
jgi:hypothetical protein